MGFHCGFFELICLLVVSFERTPFGCQGNRARPPQHCCSFGIRMRALHSSQRIACMVLWHYILHTGQFFIVSQLLSCLFKIRSSFSHTLTFPICNSMSVCNTMQGTFRVSLCLTPKLSFLAKSNIFLSVIWLEVVHQVRQGYTVSQHVCHLKLQSLFWERLKDGKCCSVALCRAPWPD